VLAQGVMPAKHASEAWGAEPWLLALLALALPAYALARLRAGPSLGRLAMLRQSGCFLVGWLALLIAVA
jgi:putative membrane protein